MIKNLLHQNQTSRLMAGLLPILKKDLKKSGKKWIDWLLNDFKKWLKRQQWFILVIRAAVNPHRHRTSAFLAI